MTAESPPTDLEATRSKAGHPRANSLGGSAWTRNSISIWSDIRRTPEETALKHPAMFPQALPARLIECLIPPGPATVLDPFAGVGSTPLAAYLSGRHGIGIELSPEFAGIAESRLRSLIPEEVAPGGSFRIVLGDASRLENVVPQGSVDLCITSPPYWDILTRKRSADGKETRHYGDEEADLGRIESYEEFLNSLGDVFQQVFCSLRPGGYCCVVVMDIRKGSRFYPFHSDVAARLEACGLVYDDLVIWDRRQEYNNLRPLGYPFVFRVNKVHEFIIITRKPR